WSNGSVGMYGEGYSGFAAWAAATHAPPALKAIATADPDAPGINWPMAGNIFHNAAYRWAQQVTGSRGDESDLDEDAAWRALDDTWYRSGRRYRDLERINKRSNRYFQRWLNHPSYDRFWQSMIPFREQFASIAIPVLTQSGYFSPGQIGALYYFEQHQKYNANADHTLLLGPYAWASGDRPGALLRRLPVDPVARLELTTLRYRWLDHVLKGAARPAVLQNRVNFQTMGTNEWHHSPSLAAMATDSLRLFLDAKQVDGNHLLLQRDTPNTTSVRTETSLKDVVDLPVEGSDDLLAAALPTSPALVYASERFATAIDIAGVVTGRLDVTPNKQDFDLRLSLYEQLSNGEYVKLFDPSAVFRASYAADRVHRRLLKSGRRQQVIFNSERVTSRRIAAGSRLVLVLGINLRPDQQINYGAGNDVSEESRSVDGRYPLRIRWHSSSFIEVPVRK
ncbi:MAG: CocE/NonD family hydrolase, partial [Steroidobacteraceae bacterium]